MSSSSESEREKISKQMMMPFHHHPLLVHHDERYSSCDLCHTGNEISGTFYECEECSLEFHKECIESFLDHPLQNNHYFKLFKDLSPDHMRICHFCRRRDFSYARCMIYNIIMCLNCVASPPPLTIYQPKHHKHNLTLLSRLVTFTCNACGLQDDRNPYVCLECNFMVHRECTDLPRVISINRHDHRISHTFHIGQKEGGGDWKCGVCRKTIDWIYGAFKCSRCLSYAVHSKCATKMEVWDGIELEDVPEEEEEIENPFKVINEEGDIIHFSHEKHILRLLDENCVTDILRCEGCVIAINGDPCYKCVECEFVLHKTCASLPRKIRHFLHRHKLVLRVDEVDIFGCIACVTCSNGFRYVCCQDDCKPHGLVYDVRCSSISEPFQHDLHPQHPLYCTVEGYKECNACGEGDDDLLSCMDCEYALCMKCATLPRKVKNIRYDDHFLSLSQGVGNSSGDLWCDICETKTDPSKCYYTCEECGISLHIDCVIGDFYYVKAGCKYAEDTDECFEVVANNGATRPSCGRCEVCCKFPFLMSVATKETVRYFCKIDCLPP